MMDILQLTPDDIAALARFRSRYPTWWYSIGFCDRTRDFTAAPQDRSPEIALAALGNGYNQGFDCDHRGSLADAIADVMEQIDAAQQSNLGLDTPEPSPVG